MARGGKSRARESRGPAIGYDFTPITIKQVKEGRGDETRRAEQQYNLRRKTRSGMEGLKKTSKKLEEEERRGLRDQEWQGSPRTF